MKYEHLLLIRTKWFLNTEPLISFYFFFLWIAYKWVTQVSYVHIKPLSLNLNPKWIWTTNRLYLSFPLPNMCGCVPHLHSICTLLIFFFEMNSITLSIKKKNDLYHFMRICTSTEVHTFENPKLWPNKN